jgi:hypothetical protein
MLEEYQNLQIAINSVTGANVSKLEAENILQVLDHLKEYGNSCTIKSIKTLSK